MVIYSQWIHFNILVDQDRTYLKLCYKTRPSITAHDNVRLQRLVAGTVNSLERNTAELRPNWV